MQVSVLRFAAGGRASIPRGNHVPDIRADSRARFQVGAGAGRAPMRRRRPRREAAYLEALVELSGTGLLVLDAKGVVRDQTITAVRILGGGDGRAVGRHLAELVHADDRDNAGRTLQAVADGSLGEQSPSLRWRMGAADRFTPVEAVLHRRLADPEIRGVVVAVRETADLRALEAQLKQAAYRDPLTGLSNRVSLIDQIQIAALTDPADELSAVLFLDLDEFKLVNDSLGHAVGDGLLVAVADRLRACMRPEDLLARLGGDEFAALLRGLGGPDHAREIAERLLAALVEPFEVGELSMSVQASMGIAVADAAQGAEQLLRNADMAMYAAKAQGRSGCVLFSTTMASGVMQRLRVKGELADGVERGEFELFYQPIVDCHSGVVQSAEALLRWRHPHRGLVLPMDFLELAEQSGVMRSLGDWILFEAMSRAAAWRRKGHDLSVGVNVSAGQWLAPDLTDRIAYMLHTARLAPWNLTLEITEQTFMQHSEFVSRNLDSLHRLGVQLAIDDFGTGYSSLAYLQRFPVDVLKIDKSFIGAVGEEPRSTALVKAIVEIARTFGLTAVAEGVESERQRRHLGAIGCELAQGYVFGRPMDAVEMTRRLDAQGSIGHGSEPVVTAQG